MSKKYHVNLAFADDAGRTRSITLNTARKVVTAPLIREALRELEMGENSTLLSVSWLGKMSEKEYVERNKRKTNSCFRATIPKTLNN